MAIRKISRRAALAVSVSAWAVFGGAAQAQDQTPAQQTSADDDEIIIVTALKREQLLIEVPLSLTVIGGETLERLNARNFKDYLGLVPGLQLEEATPGTSRLILRGINTGGVASSVAVYVDETPFGSSSGLANAAILAGDFDTFDVERIEVLRGPQGTLYGASSLGGVLKFVTVAPDTDELLIRGRATVETIKGGDESYSGNVVVNVPLGDTLAFRASGFYRKDGGFIDSVGTAVPFIVFTPPATIAPAVLTSDVEKNINESRVYGGRAALLFEPTDNLKIKLSAVLQNIDADASSIVESNPTTLEPLYGGLTFSQFVPSFRDTAYRVYNGTIDYDFGFANLLSSTSYNTFEQQIQSDQTPFLAPILGFGQLAGFPFSGQRNEVYLAQRTSQTKFTQELRLSSQSNDTFEWLIGGYYTRETGRIAQEFIPVAPGTLTRNTALPLLAAVSLDSVYKEYAAFANGTLHLGERFDVTFGGRYSRNRQNAEQNLAGLPIFVGAVTSFPSLRSNDNVFTYSVAPRFEISERVAVYARVAKGFRPGGPNVIPPAAPPGTPTTYGSDSVISYEAGLKGETADRSFGLDLSVYHIDWKDIQLFTVINGFGINGNGGTAESDGLEFTASFRPTAGLNIALNGAYVDARLTNNGGALIGGFDGDRLPYSPKYSAGVNGDYQWGLGDDVTAFVGGSFRFLSKVAGPFDSAFRTANGRQRQLPSYEVIDLRAGVNFGRYSLELFAKNVGNSRGIVAVGGVGSLPNGAIGTAILRPRSIGLTLGGSF